MKAITLLSAVPVRADRSEAAEMTTQILFAETMDLLEEDGSWAHVHLDRDGQDGWVDRKMVSTLSDADCEALAQAPCGVVKLPVAMAVSGNNAGVLMLSGGTRLPNYHDGHFSLFDVDFQIDPAMVTEGMELNRDNLNAIVPYYLNIPYLWGGRNAFGLDCSGLTVNLYSIFGINLPRNASEQAEAGEVVPFLTDAQAGDLAFFEKTPGRICHVGMILTPDTLLHCSGRVKISPLDVNGIVADDGKGYTHQLRVIKRFKQS